MSSKESKNFRRTVRTVSKNFQKYTDAMEADIQVLIASMLEVIERKIISLRKLLKLKLCVRKVKSIANLKRIAVLEDESLNTTLTTTVDTRKDNGSLDDLSSMVYEADKNSLPPPEADDDDDEDEDEHKRSRLNCLKNIADLESLCSALNRHSRNNTVNNNRDERKESLDKYIYMLIDAERKKENKPKEIGDFLLKSQSYQVVNKKTQNHHQSSQDSVVYLGKTEYESILNILNMVLKSYQMQDEITKKHKMLEKTRTETLISTTRCQSDERKIASDGTYYGTYHQQNKEYGSERKYKPRKHTCL